MYFLFKRYLFRRGMKRRRNEEKQEIQCFVATFEYHNVIRSHEEGQR